MILKNDKIEIPEDNPFAYDRLNRKESVEALTHLIGTMDGPLVLCINAPWGQGKTTFLRILRQYLVNEGFPTLHFNAWENDFSDDALISLIGEIETGIKDIVDEAQESNARKAFEKSKQYGAILVKKGLPLALKILTSGIVDADKATEAAIASFVENSAKEQIQQYEKAKMTIKNFRSSLEEFIGEINSRRTDGRNQLVFIIDELDRCRPNFAIEVLEKAKHLFSIKNIIFILSLDKEQLGHSIRSVYGTGMNVEGYLRRFIDLDYDLPIPQNVNFIGYLAHRVNLEDAFRHRKANHHTYEMEELLETISQFNTLFEMTLREQEDCFSILNLSIRATNPSEPICPIFLAFLVVLKIKKPSLYRNFFERNPSPEPILHTIELLPKGRSFLESDYGRELEAFLIRSIGDQDIQAKEVNKYRDMINSPNKYSSVNIDRTNKLLDTYQSLQYKYRCRTGIAAEILKRIEIAHGFSI